MKLDTTDKLIFVGIGNLIGAIGKTDFGNQLDKFIAHIVDYDMTAICAYSKRYKPILLHDGYYGKGKKIYLGRLY